MKLALLTHFLPTPQEDYSELAAITTPQRDDYCCRHGYEHIVHKGTYGNPTYYYAVQRLFLLHDLMKSRQDVDIWWVLNVQALITNLTLPLVKQTPLDDGALYFSQEFDFWVCHDCHGLNAGSFVVRNGDWGREWVKFIAAQSVGSNHVWHEQRVLQEHENHPFFRDRIKIVPQNRINSYDYTLYPPWNETTLGHWRPNDLVLSLPGLNLKQRLDIVRSDKWQSRIVS